MDRDTYVANVKKSKETETITREEYEWRIREIAKCKRDIVYFANHYFKILSLDTGITQITLYPKQEEMLKFFKEEKRCICLSARQSSKTTTYTIFLLWCTIFFPEKKAMILANKAVTAIEIMSRIQLGYENLPNWIKPKVIIWNKGQIMFSNKSEIRGFASSSDAARGFSAQIICLDEFAFLQKNIADKLFTSIYPVVSTAKDGKIIIVSTPNGTVNNLYYDLWQQANSKTKNEEGWKPFEMHWWDVPGRDDKFKETTIASIGERRWAQEFACEFLSDGQIQNLIPTDIIEKFKRRYEEYKKQNDVAGKTLDLISKNNDKVFNITMWKAFDPRRTYLASGDVAEGTGNDSSVLYIWDVTELDKIELVAKFADNTVSVIEFAYVCKQLCEAYANPIFIVENNGVGSSLLDLLRVSYGYQNIVKEGTNNNPYGVRSHVSIKPKACLWCRDMFTTQGFDWIIRDYNLFNEMSSFVKKVSLGKNSIGTYQALSNAHDDLMLSLIWAAYVLQTDIIDKYFVVTETFTSSLGIVYPKRLEPGMDYTIEEVQNAKQNSLYRDFMNGQIIEEKTTKEWNKEYKKSYMDSQNKFDPFSSFNYKRHRDDDDDDIDVSSSGSDSGYFIGENDFDDFDGPSW